MRTLLRSGLENSAHVLEQSGKMYSATLGLVDIVRGTNSYYKLQLLEDDVQKRSVAHPQCAVCRQRAGRICVAAKGSLVYLYVATLIWPLQAISRSTL